MDHGMLAALEVGNSDRFKLLETVDFRLRLTFIQFTNVNP
jgi:hypothetical protein